MANDLYALLNHPVHRRLQVAFGGGIGDVELDAGGDIEKGAGDLGAVVDALLAGVGLRGDVGDPGAGGNRSVTAEVDAVEGRQLAEQYVEAEAVESEVDDAHFDARAVVAGVAPGVGLVQAERDLVDVADED